MWLGGAITFPKDPEAPQGTDRDKLQDAARKHPLRQAILAALSKHGALSGTEIVRELRARHGCNLRSVDRHARLLAAAGLVVVERTPPPLFLLADASLDAETLPDTANGAAVGGDLENVLRSPATI